MTVTTVGSSGGQTGAPHKWLTGVAMFPAYIAGVSGGAPASTRSHLMAMTGFYLFNPTNSAVTNIAMGDTLTVGGSTYYILGATGIATTSTSDYGIAVDGSIF
jgi:hypothetical protein